MCNMKEITTNAERLKTYQDGKNCGLHNERCDAFARADEHRSGAGVKADGSALHKPPRATGDAPANFSVSRKQDDTRREAGRRADATHYVNNTIITSTRQPSGDEADDTLARPYAIITQISTGGRREPNGT